MNAEDVQPKLQELAQTYGRSRPSENYSLPPLRSDRKTSQSHGAKDGNRRCDLFRPPVHNDRPFTPLNSTRQEDADIAPGTGNNAEFEAVVSGKRNALRNWVPAGGFPRILNNSEDFLALLDEIPRGFTTAVLNHSKQSEEPEGEGYVYNDEVEEPRVDDQAADEPHKCPHPDCDAKFRMPSQLKLWKCTLLPCQRKFGSKHDWKRHENGKHLKYDTWVCNVQNAEGESCSKTFYWPGPLRQHLQKAHDIQDGDLRKEKANEGMRRQARSSFWCGFCSKWIIIPEPRQQEGSDIRWDHIDTHFRKVYTELDHGQWEPEQQISPRNKLRLEVLPPPSDGTASSKRTSELEEPEALNEDDEGQRKRALSEDIEGEPSHKHRKS
ncbi:C2H2 type zinc finger domain protein [Fusarium austroafricanum]|uniref:C2H2 type zinc finger domain protein n=1 Tax=Fusarium austroafricanum TaxID=2364996 RepID=A0A8H4NYM1_9HYPO|nr:C2H2 type zinc finger domain protein [Fusarium austroafricanum]